MLYKTINLAPVAFLDNNNEVNNLVGIWLKYSDLIYIKQPSTDTRIPTIFQDSVHFEKLRKLSKDEIARNQKLFPNYKTKDCTSCMFVDQNNIEIVSSPQDYSKHKFEFSNDMYCIREKKKYAGTWKSEDGYEMCPGCAADNHGEPNAIRKGMKEGRLDQIKGSTAYIHNHWWACDDCRQKMFELGVKQIILDPVCTRIFGDKHVSWYRENDL
jgi:Cytidine and deoxycytidylate deaminase zinc-binding region